MKIRLLVMDVDGTLTDGKIYISPEGEFVKAFDIKDGYGIVKMRQYGIIPVIITGRQSGIMEQRCKELKIDELYQGVGDKKAALLAVAEKYGVSMEEIAYIGDDENDMECLGIAGFPACPADAVEGVKEICRFISAYNGGNGAVRELVEQVIYRNRQVEEHT